MTDAEKELLKQVLLDPESRETISARKKVMAERVTPDVKEAYKNAVLEVCFAQSRLEYAGAQIPHDVKRELRIEADQTFFIIEAVSHLCLLGK